MPFTLVAKETVTRLGKQERNCVLLPSVQCSVINHGWPWSSLLLKPVFTGDHKQMNRKLNAYCIHWRLFLFQILNAVSTAHSNMMVIEIKHSLPQWVRLKVVMSFNKEQIFTFCLKSSKQKTANFCQIGTIQQNGNDPWGWRNVIGLWFLSI